LKIISERNKTFRSKKELMKIVEYRLKEIVVEHRLKEIKEEHKPKLQD